MATEDLRFLLVGPFTCIALTSFALYFGPRNAGWFQKGQPQTPTINFKLLGRTFRGSPWATT